MSRPWGTDVKLFIVLSSVGVTRFKREREHQTGQEKNEKLIMFWWGKRERERGKEGERDIGKESEKDQAIGKQKERWRQIKRLRKKVKKRKRETGKDRENWICKSCEQWD